MATAKKETTEEATTVTETGEELVEVFIPRDSRNRQENKFVSVNGVGMLIPVGKRVKVPKRYAEVLENSFNQQEEAYQKINGLSN